MKKLSQFIKNLIEFLTVGIWKMPLHEGPGVKSFLIKQLRIIMLAFRGFSEDKVQLRASALTFYSLLSVVPTLAMIFGIAKGFGFQNKLEEELVNGFEGHEEALNWIINMARNYLENVKGGVIAGIGLIVLFWTVMGLLSNIERSFNGIWQIKKSRPFFRKFSDYLSIMLIAPIFFFVASSANVFITSQIDMITTEVAFLGQIKPVINFFLHFIPYFLIWFLLTIVYMAMPNTKVNFTSALVGGIIAGTLVQLSQWGYVYFQIGVSRYNALYGSFAALPLFLIWLQISWLIVLLGAEISFAKQNVARYEYEYDSLNISYKLKRILTLLVANHVIKIFEKGDSPLTSYQLAKELKIPVRMVRDITFELTEAGIFSETLRQNPKEKAYQPGRDIHAITVHSVLKKLENKGMKKMTSAGSKEYLKIAGVVEDFEQTIENSPSNILLKDI
ncbi:MAG: YihY/virulence factor BrkB family protein [Bacteroidetes bacterium]|nr:YihY/virulence factor BrkB family protein [Bacteroidota bacterium]